MKLKMSTSLSGSEYSLAPGDEHEFEDAEGLRHFDAGHGTFDGTDEELAAIRERFAPIKIVAAEAGESVQVETAVKKTRKRETTAKKVVKS